jgi:hypothetical protein
MRDFIKRHEANALLAALVASVFSIIVGSGSVYYTYISSIKTQDRQAKLEALANFEQDSSKVVDAVGEFILVINSSKDAPETQKKLYETRKTIMLLTAKQIGQAQGLQRFFVSNRELDAYVEYLEEFNRTAQDTNGPTEMRPLVEGFGRINDTKTIISRELYSKLGIQG